MKEEIKENIKSIKEYAKENKVPIMLEDGISYLCNYIKKNRVKNVLEIGTAIGYSAIRMALVSRDIYVKTLEKDEQRYSIALENINDFKLKRQIEAICVDALDYEEKGKYDLIFIDAAKSKNIEYFLKYQSCISKKGTIITDNLSFHGLVEKPELIKTKNQGAIVRKIKEYLNFLDENKEFETTYIDVGDKISISKRINNE